MTKFTSNTLNQVSLSAILFTFLDNIENPVMKDKDKKKKNNPDF
jgi:hypothetical protein